MREETKNWLKQAEADLRKANVLFETNNFDGAVFFYQQTAEKALKSLCLVKLKEIPQGHSIIYLATLVKVPREMFSGIRDLNPEYLITRYPDMAAGVPSEMYDREIAARHKKTAQEILKWVKNQIKE